MWSSWDGFLFWIANSRNKRKEFPHTKSDSVELRAPLAIYKWHRQFRLSFELVNCWKLFHKINCPNLVVAELASILRSDRQTSCRNAIALHSTTVLSLDIYPHSISVYQILTNDNKTNFTARTIQIVVEIQSIHRISTVMSLYRHIFFCFFWAIKCWWPRLNWISAWKNHMSYDAKGRFIEQYRIWIERPIKYPIWVNAYDNPPVIIQSAAIYAKSFIPFCVVYCALRNAIYENAFNDIFIIAVRQRQPRASATAPHRT